MSSRVAWSLLGLTIVLVALFAYLATLSAGVDGPLEYGHPAVVAAYGGLALSFPLVGAVVASRRPDNAIGWMFCGVGVAISAALCSQLYAEYGTFGGSELPGTDVAGWASSWLFPVGLFAVPLFLLFLFPTGKPHAEWSRWAVRGGFAVVLVGFLADSLSPGFIEPRDLGIRNPFGLRGVAGEVAGLIGNLDAFALPFFLAGVAALVSRMRAATGVERQQLKLFAYVASLMSASFALALLFGSFDSQILSDIFFVIGALALMSIPVVSGLAILRYRLYDIDVVVNKTLVYASLTAILGLVYSGLVVSLQSLLSGTSADSDVAVAASTLAVAGLFGPVRRQVQGFIDRRFYRSRYDATRTLEMFAYRLRDEVTLETVSEDLVQVVGESVQPEAVSLWLPEDSGVQAVPR